MINRKTLLVIGKLAYLDCSLPVNLNIAKTINQYLLLLLFTFSVNLQASECQTIRVNGPNGWEPISYRDDNGQLTGMAVEVVNRVFAQLGVKLKYGPKLPWKRQQHRLENGTLDLIIAAYFNKDRAKKFTYSEAYHIEKISIFVHRDRAFEFQSLDNLKGKMGLRPLGGTYGDHFDKFAKNHLNIKEYSDYGSNIHRIYQGHEDYIILALLDGLISAKKYGYYSTVIPLPKDVAQLPIHFLLSKKSPCINLIKRINSALTDLKSSNFTKNIEEKYLRQLE